MPALDFLNQNESAVKIPTGGDWTPSGMIGFFMAKVLFSFYSTTDFNIAETTQKPYLSRKTSDGYFYYFKTAAEADQMKETLGNEYKPNQVWYWYSPRDKVLNVDPENLTKWSEIITFNLQIATLGSQNHRHELHLIALPSAVASAAKFIGLDCPAMDFKDLVSNQTVFDDAFALKTAGFGDDKKAYLNSTLWKQRAAIWEALGEKDPTKYQPKGTGTKFDTESDKLSGCLKILTVPWAHPTWCRVVNVFDPRVDAVKKDDSRLTIPALTEIFSDEKAARTVAAEEMKARDERKAAKSNGSVSGVVVPAGYVGQEQLWLDFVNPLKSNPSIKGKPAPMVMAFLKKSYPDEAQLGATYDELFKAVTS